jgi:hypothetical protein
VAACDDEPSGSLVVYKGVLCMRKELMAPLVGPSQDVWEPELDPQERNKARNGGMINKICRKVLSDRFLNL